ncbi:type II toxin-antitoxin system RelE/ParE family toxin [Pusillimonas caeni]|uniref:type II toxin-antitoxin system RelE/ParE family toxin n=1 Tax=Pusillimonas caeni TaxID=1348472 RepID=UPI000E599B39|nr:type II toxin-antitoxin system RelE/ParE family toxin [Pusillimonas caeni]TFL14815.1 type II toxin-antitoxin system RelE/ParE family toxin [Pusillimonas caeni]
MSTYTVVFTPEAQQQLLELYRYIAQRGAPLAAQRYTDAIVSTCEALASFPRRGVARNDIRPGLRLTHHKKNTAIAFTVTGRTVTIIGVFYGGQDIPTAFD